MKSVRVAIVVLLILALGVAYWRFSPKSAVHKAYRICATCGMTQSDVDGLVQAFTGAKEPRETLLSLYRLTFDDPTKVDCEDCSEAILNAAGVP